MDATAAAASSVATRTCRTLARAAVVLWSAATLLAAPAALAQSAATAASPVALATAAGRIRFSALAELTPRNVHGLLPLSALALQTHDAPPAEHSGGHEPDAWAASQAVSVAETLGLAQNVNIAAANADTAGSAAAFPAAANRTGTPVSFFLSSAASGGAREQLTAWDPVRRRAVWVVKENASFAPGALLTAGGLVFYRSLDGWLKALDARSGAVLWKHRIEARGFAAANVRGPISYRGAGGHQYVAVLSPGGGSSYALQAFALPH